MTLSKRSKVKNPAEALARTNKQKSKVIIFVFGPPGSGKGTQAKLLAKKFDLEYFGSGVALRERQKAGDFTSKKLIEVMKRGEWVPESTICNLWLNKLEKFKKLKNFHGLVYDGGPRRMLEAKLFYIDLTWYEWEKNLRVIFINISNREIINRLTKRRQCKECGRLIPWIGDFKKIKKCDKCEGMLVVRADDKLEAIKKRLGEFKKHTIPVINYLRKQNKIIEINGEQSIERVFQDILKALRKK